MISESQSPEKLHKNESIKASSAFLRGTILEGLSDSVNGSISADDQQLTKFHGIYQQDNRDIRAERRRKKLDKAYTFMARICLPGGICTPDQWIAVDDLSNYCEFNTLKLTTRQAFQLHGILKSNLKHTIKTVNDALLTTLAACGDVNRNVMCNPNPPQSEVYSEVQAIAEVVDTQLKPKTSAYAEIWLDGDKVLSHGEKEVEPLYGATYLPRKFKIAFAIPPHNDVDVFAHCLGFIAIIEDDRLLGFNVTIGGGLGMTHGNEATFPRLADVIGFCTPDQVVAVSEKIVSIQRDFGDRSNRAHARFKYTVEDRGADFILKELNQRLGFSLEPAKPYKFESNGDRYGWVQDYEGYWNLGLFIEGGRVADSDSLKLKTGLRKIAEVHSGDFRLTANQNIIIGRVAESDKEKIDALVKEHQLDGYAAFSGLRKHQIACVALPTCGLALAESERYLPKLVSEIEVLLEELGLFDEPIVIRSTGCPNGCGRPYLGEIGLVGKVPGKYNLYLGAGFEGERLNKLYKASVTHEQILASLKPIFIDYAKNRQSGERLGDFTIRAGYVNATDAGREFHANLKETQCKD
ncbi:MAG: sulfite reductase [Puniceicoccaceae bacterium]|nr:sulfite reductase [Puniceicoccaceae bacterium]|tara:strand:+ start:303 stop:2039 length:1737 start_codon:yes stop_codon:yes gene_type:complete